MSDDLSDDLVEAMKELVAQMDAAPVPAPDYMWHPELGHLKRVGDMWVSYDPDEEST